jgi:hypothetical protein
MIIMLVLVDCKLIADVCETSEIYYLCLESQWRMVRYCVPCFLSFSLLRKLA